MVGKPTGADSESAREEAPGALSELSEDYQSAGFSRRLGWGVKPALLVVDAASAYTERASALFLPTAAGSVRAMETLLDAARQAGRPVLYTRVTYRAAASDAPLFWHKVPALAAFERGSPYAGWPEALQPREDERIIDKHYASAFFGTDLASTLTTAGVDTVVVCGYSTSGCVRASAVDALQYGFRPMVVGEACADRADAPHRANLFDLDAKYADVVSLAEAVEHLAPGGSLEKPGQDARRRQPYG